MKPWSEAHAAEALRRTYEIAGAASAVPKGWPILRVTRIRRAR